jgi:hypothetical protein
MPEFRSAPNSPVIRLPTLRSVPWDGKVLLELVGSQMVPVDVSTELYIGPNGYTDDPDQAQNFAAGSNVTIESPGAPGKSAYQLWLDAVNTGTYADYYASLKGPRGDDASDDQVAIAVSQYLATNPPQNGEDGQDATPEQVAEAVSIYLQANPPAAGQNATPTQIAAAVSDWLTANPPSEGPQGEPGVKGDPGADASDVQVASQVASYLSIHPPAQGAPGNNATDQQVAQGVATYIGSHPIADGKSIEIQVSGGQIQTRQTGGQWTNLISLAALTGASGNPGADGKQVELQKTSTAIQWRLTGGTFVDLVQLSALTGAQGNPGVQGNPGNAGTAATIAAGAVTKSGPGTAPTVTNAGTSSAAVFNFGLPIGLSGIQVGTVTLAESAVIAISAGVRALTFTVPGVIAGETLLIAPNAGLPIGYGIFGVIATATNTVQVTLIAPLLAIGASYSIPCKIIALR